MERSFGSKYGKWIALTAVVLALVLWFVLSGGVENYRAKYEGYDLSQQIGDIGRSSTYSLYLRAHEGAPDASSDVSIPLVTVDSDGVTAQKDGLLMQSGSSATFAVTVPETGFYNIRRPTALRRHAAWTWSANCASTAKYPSMARIR